MKVVPMSDLHGYLPDPHSVPECDVVCICGDIVPLQYQSDDIKSLAWFYLEFLPWTDNLRCTRVLFVAGNHDFFLEHLMQKPNGVRRSASEVMEKLLPGENRSLHKITYLRDSSARILGKTFYGTPWIGGLPNWAFNLSSDEREQLWKQIPKKLDVLLTHGAPDLCYVGTVLQSSGFQPNYGDPILAEAVKGRDIQYTFCGHIHSGLHKPSLVKEPAVGERENFVCNVSVKDENYHVTTEKFELFEI